MTTNYRINHNLRQIVFRARFLTPISHHDPSVNDSSNANLFLRRAQVVPRSVSTPLAPDAMPNLANLLPVPESLHGMFAELSPGEFLATALLHQFITAYATGDGLGLFAGPERYRRLEERARQQAIRSTTAFGWWGGLASEMQVGAPLRGDSTVQGALLTMPAALAQLALAAIAKNSTSAVMLARLWNEAAQQEKRNKVLKFGKVHINESADVVAQVPAISANSIRHEMVREPGAIHLLNALGLQFDDLPDGVAALLYNGGDLNQAAPSNAFKLSRQIRELYPLFGLLGGSTSGFILGASNLEVSAWLAVTENAAALERYNIQPQLSAFDLLDQETQTRHTNKRVDGSPMPFGFETLATGTQAVVEFRLRPYATQLEAGALIAALETYTEGDSTLFGQSARGFGLANLETLRAFDDLEESRNAYNAYVQENAEELRHGLVNATLGTGKQVI